MTVSLDTSELKKIRIRIDAGNRVSRYAYAAYADSALPKIAKVLGGKKPSAVGVVAGPGAWSATRTGVAIGNALAYAWKIPVIPLTAEQFASQAPLPRGKRGIAAVVYGSAPNITRKKNP